METREGLFYSFNLLYLTVLCCEKIFQRCLQFWIHALVVAFL